MNQVLSRILAQSHRSAGRDHAGLRRRVSRVIGLLSAVVIAAAVASCGSDEPEPRWDYATYRGQEAVAFTPIPGADLETWRTAIESLGIDEWTRAGATDRYSEERYAPREDERVDTERREWSVEHVLDGSTPLIAQAVTDASDELLFVYCEVQNHRGSDGVVLPAAWEALSACAGGAGNDEMDAAELSTWAGEVLTGFESQPSDGFQPSVERLQSGPVQAFLTDDGTHTAVSVSVAPDSTEVAS